MPNLSLKSNHKSIKEYYRKLQQLDKLGINNEIVGWVSSEINIDKKLITFESQRNPPSENAIRS